MMDRSIFFNQRPDPFRLAPECYLISLLAIIFHSGIFLSGSASAQSSAQYVVEFEGTWSASTHPNGFPPNPHFSGLIGVSHDSTIAFWAPDSIASQGIESMAETGSKVALTNEINAAIDAGQAQFLLSGGGIGTSPGSITMFFDVNEQFPLVTLVSMLAPSPDWFVGVRDLNLFVNGAWVEEATIDLFVYDAGTDSGANYTSSNQDTQPREPIFRIEQAPFLINNAVEPVGRFLFRLIAGVDSETPASIPDNLQLSNGFPNPFSHTATLSFTPHRTQNYRVAVYDMLGRRIQTLLDGTLTAGTLTTLEVDGTKLPPGPYIVRAAGEKSATNRLIVLIK